jgi:hypothetical protein
MKGTRNNAHGPDIAGQGQGLIFQLTIGQAYLSVHDGHGFRP